MARPSWLIGSLVAFDSRKLVRFKEIFPAAAKSDRIDTRKTLELFHLT
ncbi:MAG: hypothetical protein O7E52_00235 [Candidatus Poribacteria bacterium]|nr:hypothetical protein [Candidatus Poribacteria bacterium]